MYIKRHSEEIIRKLAKLFGCIMVSGARQVGKTTLLKNVTEGINYITLDDPIALQSAITESGTFFKDFPPPVFVDEIQYAPNLFPYIKMSVDTSKLKGQFYLSGSQQFKLMKNVSESLAGRIGLINLPGLSLREISGVAFDKPFLPTEEYFQEGKKHFKMTEYNEIWNCIYRGSMPEMYVADMEWHSFYGAYTKTYLERDVRDLAQVGDDLKFIQFMTVMASMTGNMLNLSSVARDVGISQPTAARWLSILLASNIVYLLPPYFNNITKRTIKTPKLYFLDTGLAAYLTKWNTQDVLKNGAMAGAFFETFVIGEIIKSYYNQGILDPPLYYYRDKDHNEIDLLIMEGDTLYPLEIKKHANPSPNDFATFAVLDKIKGIKRGPGGVICNYERLITLQGNDKTIPVWMI